ncbi:hypothetical protein QUA43_08795 [Microcoleus sp. N9_B4]|uniref:hypothetical protein n=1 Tax=Microcoleus sp. N9_B4 TaxID=3055386 RepID=UPI002FD63126
MSAPHIYVERTLPTYAHLATIAIEYKTDFALASLQTHFILVDFFFIRLTIFVSESSFNYDESTYYQATFSGRFPEHSLKIQATDKWLVLHRLSAIVWVCNQFLLTQTEAVLTPDT